ncbi:MAG: hypothetical protein ABR538_17735 [Candidatus Binatia bacterium]
MIETATDALTATVSACDAVNAPYAVIGGVARNAWAPPRATTDLDLAIFVTPQVYDSLIRELASLGFQPQSSASAEADDALPDVVLLRRPTGIVRRLDLLVAKTPFEREAIEQAIVVDIGIPCRVVRPEHLIVYKLIAGRPRDLGDAEDVARTRQAAGAPVDFSVVRRWAREWTVEDRLDRLVSALQGVVP